MPFRVHLREPSPTGRDRNKAINLKIRYQNQIIDTLSEVEWKVTVNGDFLKKNSYDSLI